MNVATPFSFNGKQTMATGGHRAVHRQATEGKVSHVKKKNEIKIGSH